MAKVRGGSGWVVDSWHESPSSFENRTILCLFGSLDLKNANRGCLARFARWALRLRSGQARECARPQIMFFWFPAVMRV